MLVKLGSMHQDSGEPLDQDKPGLLHRELELFAPSPRLLLGDPEDKSLLLSLSLCRAKRCRFKQLFVAKLLLQSTQSYGFSC
mmetsp:Transcript_39311/g.155958  ORF Transcript_39311/g.155958 Transcript_39311/m.155958 type:complete len:82 (+) Transcript_39311:142-387(+)